MSTSGVKRWILTVVDLVANTGKHPSSTQPLARAAGITVNGLVVLDTELDLPAYFEEHVIVGEDAFVEVVEEKQDLARSIIRKLVREISGQPMASLNPGRTDLAARDCVASPKICTFDALSPRGLIAVKSED